MRMLLAALPLLISAPAGPPTTSGAPTVPPRTSRTTVRLSVTDLVGLEELQREFGAFVEVLERASGLDVEF